MVGNWKNAGNLLAFSGALFSSSPVLYSRGAKHGRFKTLLVLSFHSKPLFFFLARRLKPLRILNLRRC